MPIPSQIYHPSKLSSIQLTNSLVSLHHRLGLLHSIQGDIVSEIRKGLSVAVIHNLIKELEIPQKQFLKYISLSPSTFSRRCKEKHLNLNESNRVFRITMAYHEALELFNGNTKQARLWLNEPAKYLKGSTPLEYLDTEAGFLEIEVLIGRLKYGVIT